MLAFGFAVKLVTVGHRGPACIRTVVRVGALRRTAAAGSLAAEPPVVGPCGVGARESDATETSAIQVRTR